MLLYLGSKWLAGWNRQRERRPWRSHERVNLVLVVRLPSLRVQYTLSGLMRHGPQARVLIGPLFPDFLSSSMKCGANRLLIVPLPRAVDSRSHPRSQIMFSAVAVSLLSPKDRRPVTNLQLAKR